MENSLVSRTEAILRNILGGDLDLEKPRSRVETLLIALMRMIEDLEPGGGSNWLGETTTELYDGCIASEIDINGETVAVKIGDIASYQHEEYIFDGVAWQALGQYLVIDTEPEEDSPNPVSSGGVFTELSDIKTLLMSLDDRVTALEEGSHSDTTVDYDKTTGYLLVDGSTVVVDDDGYLIVNGEIDSDGYLTISSSGGEWDGGTIVITGGTLMISGDNASIEDGKLVFDAAVNGTLNFTSEGGGGDSDTSADYDINTGLLTIDGDGVSYNDQIGYIIIDDESITVDSDGYLSF